jgi:hypothetical protein
MCAPLQGRNLVFFRLLAGGERQIRDIYNAIVTIVIMVTAHLLLLGFTSKASLQYVYHRSGHSLYLC